MKKIIPAIIAFFAPIAAHAQGAFGPTQVIPGGQDAEGVLTTFERIINVAIPIIVAAGVAYFFFGVVKYITAKEDDDKQAARDTMISGIIGLFVIVAIWGIIALLANTLGIGIGGDGSAVIPTI